MKHLFYIAILILHIGTVNAQELTFSEKSTSTDPINLSIGDTTYVTYSTSLGSLKMQRISTTTNKTYWMYLGYKTSHIHNKQTVFTNKDNNKYWYYIVGKTGYPLKRKLTIN